MSKRNNAARRSVEEVVEANDETPTLSINHELGVALTDEDLEDIGIEVEQEHTDEPAEEFESVDGLEEVQGQSAEDVIVPPVVEVEQAIEEPIQGVVMAKATDALGRTVEFLVDLSAIDPTDFNVVEEADANEEQLPSSKPATGAATLDQPRPATGFGPELKEEFRLSGITDEAFQKIYGPLNTKSDKIRAMFADGYSKACIARMVTNGLYQHVYNVLKQNLKRSKAA